MAILLLGFINGLRAQSELNAQERQRFNEMFFKAEAHKIRGDNEQALSIFKDLSELSPSNATVHYELAGLYSDKEDADLARYHAERAYALAPENRWFRQLLALIYAEYGPKAKLISFYEDLADSDTASREVREALAMAYLQDKDFKRAEKTLDALQKDLGLDQQLAKLYQSLYLASGEVEEAADIWRKLLELEPSLENYAALAALYRANDRHEKALELYKRMVAIDSTDPRPHLDLANYYQRQGKYAQSIRHLKLAMASPELPMDQKIPVLLSLFNASRVDSSLLKEAYGIMDQLIRRGSEDPRLFAMYGDYLAREGRDMEAIRYYKKALAQPQGVKFQIWEQVLLIEIQNSAFDSLAVDAERAIESFPNQPLPYLYGGIAYLQTGRPEEAEELLLTGNDLVFGNAQLKVQFQSQLAEAYHKMGDYAESDRYFEAALAKEPKNANMLNNYAYYLSLRGEKLDKALKMTQKSNQLRPDNATYLDTWAWVHFKRNEFKQAEEIMEKAIALSAKIPAELWQHLGAIKEALGKNQEAIEAFRKAIKAGGNKAELEAKIKALS